ncbi:3-keto-5-aminohexanoate cleavage protein [Microbacterium sp.]|uniref:3-keto-5-aminohexanoate cleavage protein n=1 Tax=Microbacterium sp. TaxID=51671 RepID=UPI002812761A|nr:3-keto-5-aminohexanoate cleavage protein [Microbacterium sp.]
MRAGFDGRSAEGRAIRVQVCVNGARDVTQHPRLSADATIVADGAADAVAAGAREIHVHPKDAAGQDSLAGGDVARWLRAVRAACPGVPVGVTTGAWAEPEVERRLAAIAGWTELPDFASVNWHEEGADEVAALLQSRGVGVEAGIWDGSGLEAWRRSPVRADCLRAMIELPDEPAENVRRHAEGLLAHVVRAEPGMPVLLHGEERSTWTALDLAIEWGLDARIGLEDGLTLPDGSLAGDNAALVRAAVARMPVVGP